MKKQLHSYILCIYLHVHQHVCSPDLNDLIMSAHTDFNKCHKIFKKLDHSNA